MSGMFLEEDNWQRTLDIDLTAALLGVRLAANAMQRSNSKGEALRLKLRSNMQTASSSSWLLGLDCPPGHTLHAVSPRLCGTMSFCSTLARALLVL